MRILEGIKSAALATTAETNDSSSQKTINKNDHADDNTCMKETVPFNQVVQSSTNASRLLQHKPQMNSVHNGNSKQLATIPHAISLYDFESSETG